MPDYSLVDKIIKLQEDSSKIEPLGDDLEQLTQKVVDYAHKYLREINEINAYENEDGYGEQLSSTEFTEYGQD